MSVNVSAICHELLMYFGPPPTNYTMCREEARLFGIMKSILMNASTGELEAEESDLPFLNHEDVSDANWEPEDETAEALIESENGLIKFSASTVSVEKVQAALVYWRNLAGSKPRSIDSLMHTHRFLKTESDIKTLRKFEKEKEARDSRVERLDKLKQSLAEEVFRKFEEGISLHDEDLRRIALKMNDEYKYVDRFIASPSWISRFKRFAGITSRRITTFTSKKSIRDKDAITAAAEIFVADLRNEIVNSPTKVFINADQSGFNKEMSAPRSLAKMGEKTVVRMAQSVSAMSHSYTILPLHYSSGRLGSFLYVQLQEPNGAFPTSKAVFSAPNIVVVPGRSHIMTKTSMCDWIKRCVVTEPYNEIVLLLDSWSSFRDIQLIESLATTGKTLEVRTIPAGATSLIQPCDLFFFQYFKKVVRSFHHHVHTQSIDYNLAARDNILKVLSQVYRVFTHDNYREFVKHAWIIAGYIDKPVRTAKFSTPDEDLFVRDSRPCSTSGCSEKMGFVKCPYCSLVYCFKHYVVDFHWC